MSQPDFAARLRALQTTLRQTMRSRDLLPAVVRDAHASLDPLCVSACLLDLAAGWLPAGGAAVVVAAPAGDCSCLASRQVPPGFDRAFLAIATWVVKQGEAFWTADLSADARVSRAPAAAVAALPLSSRGRVFGALIVLDPVPASQAPSLDGDIWEEIRALLEIVGVALDNALLYRRLEALSVTDDLTGLYNLRYLNQALRREVKRSVRGGHPLSLLFVDLDGFKGINDRHGHLAGSRALVEMAAVLRRSARETDILSRYGGDEFALVLPDTGANGAMAVAERVRTRIAQHRFLAAARLDIRLTASVGIATFPGAATSPEGLMQAADAAMYRVKDRGKNGIEVAIP